MGYDAFARHILGIQVTKDQFITTTYGPLNVCSNGHSYEFDPPKFCPECGKQLHPVEIQTPSSELIEWLGEALLGDTDAVSAWEKLAERGTDHIGVHAADAQFCEGPPDLIVFGRLLGYIGSDQQAGGETGFTIPELQSLVDEITAEAAKLGIAGDVKLYLQLYESI